MAATVPPLLTKGQEKIRSVFHNANHKIRKAAKLLDNTINGDPFTRANISHMFANAQNTFITGGSFTISSSTTETSSSSLEIMYRRVAPNAILNAWGRADEVRCHPGTREEVIGRIEKWADEQDGQTTPMFWLSGPAGAGKSAIMQTVAERWEQRGVPQANFFFFRADASRNHASMLVATLLHQIILLYPSLRDTVAKMLAVNPLIFDSTFVEQLVLLIVTPLRAIQQSSPPYRPLLILVDGLDECETKNKLGQHQILHAFDQVLGKYPWPFRLLIASRPELQIQQAFNEISSSLIPLHLDDRYSPENDIRAFVNDRFKEVRKIHPLSHTLDAAWPSVKDVEEIVRNSSGQFIYAATIMRFISSSSTSPMRSLERVLDSAQISTRSPFLELDALYAYILSRVADQQALKDILHAHFVVEPEKYLPRSHLTLQQILSAYDNRYTDAVIRSCIADMSAIARFEGEELTFYHASLANYLLDESRSREYFVDTRAFNAKIQPRLLEQAKQNKKVKYSDSEEYNRGIRLAKRGR